MDWALTRTLCCSSQSSLSFLRTRDCRETRGYSPPSPDAQSLLSRARARHGVAARGCAARATAAAAAAVPSEPHPWAATPGHPHSTSPHPPPLITKGGQSIDWVILASLCLFAHNNTQPLDGEREGGGGGQGGRGRGGGTYFPGPSPLCASGDKGGRVLPLTPLECKQQQMNKNKIQKARGSSQACPHPGVLAVNTGGPLAVPLHHSCLHPRAAWHWPFPRASPGLRTAGPAVHTSDGRQALCWCAGLGGTSVERREANKGYKVRGVR